MELLVAFLIAFGYASPADKDALLNDRASAEALYGASSLSRADQQRIIEIEQDGM